MSSTMTPPQNNSTSSSSSTFSSSSNNNNDNSNHSCIKEESAVHCGSDNGDGDNQPPVNILHNLNTQLLAANNNPSNAMEELLGFLDEHKKPEREINSLTNSTGYWENYLSNLDTPVNNSTISNNNQVEMGGAEVTPQVTSTPSKPSSQQIPPPQIDPNTNHFTINKIEPNSIDDPVEDNINYDDETAEQLMERAAALMGVNHRRTNRHNAVVEISDSPAYLHQTTSSNSHANIAAVLADADEMIATVNNVISNSSMNEENDSIIEIRTLRNASPLLVLSDEDDDVIFVGQTAAASVIDLSETTTPPRVVSPVVDEIPDDQVVNFLLEHTRPPDHHSFRGRQSGRHINYPLVQMVAQQMEESATTSAALAVAAYNAAAAAEAVKAATPPKRSRAEQTNQKEINCPVCLEQPFDNRPFVTKCGHVFCEKCIKKAVKLSKKCPMCNRKLGSQQMHPIYF